MNIWTITCTLICIRISHVILYPSGEEKKFGFLLPQKQNKTKQKQKIKTKQKTFLG